MALDMFVVCVCEKEFNGWTREASNKVHNPELKLFLEVELGLVILVYEVRNHTCFHDILLIVAGWTSEASNKVHNPELKLFLEVELFCWCPCYIPPMLVSARAFDTYVACWSTLKIQFSCFLNLA